MKYIFSLFLIFNMIGCSVPAPKDSDNADSKPPIEELFPLLESKKNLSQATFAGGCFWCTESSFQELEGVEEAISGYAGGEGDNPSYENHQGYREALRVYYDSEQISYSELMTVYWKTIDPVDAGGQFADRGHSYTTAIYYANDTEKNIAESSKSELDSSGEFDVPVATKIIPLTNFFPAEEYHQDFYKHSHKRYKGYKNGSGRTKYFEDRSDDQEEVKDKKEGNTKSQASTAKSYALTPEQIETRRKNLDELSYKVIAREGTEKAFGNKYWDNKEKGIYVDKVSGEPLYASIHKYDSGTGWPSFSQALDPENIVEKVDKKLFVTRTEARSKHGDSHLGHIFNDGPEPTGVRHCINSASLRFVPLEDLQEEGYEEWLEIFE